MGERAPKYLAHFGSIFVSLYRLYDPIMSHMQSERNGTAEHRLTLDDLRRLPSISVDEAAVVLGIGRTAAYAAARRGEIPTVRIGARIRVPTGRLLQMLDGCAGDTT